MNRRLNKLRNRHVFHFRPFSKKQRQVLNWWTSGSPVREYDGIIADGAIRSGKTVSMSLSFVMWAMETYNEQNFAMCGKTIGSFRRNVLSSLKPMLASRGYYVEEYRTDNLITVSRNGRENYFYLFGGKDERSQDLIQGITLAGVFFDEVALMPESFVNQATGRCSVDGSKYWFNCNPAGPYHWFKTEWIDKAKEKNILYLHFTMDDNLSLSERIRERYRSQYSGVFFKRYILGIWCLAEGLIYDMFEPERHVKPILAFFRILKDRNRYVSIDYGTLNATAMLIWNQGTDGIWYCTREYYYSGRDQKKQKTDADYANDLMEWLDGTKIKAIIVDPSAASFITELRKRGWKVIKANNDVLDGIREVSTRLNKDEIIIASSCENLTKEMQTYAWDEKAAEHGEDKPIKVFDHGCDAMRYFVATILGNKTAAIKDKKAAGFK